MIFCRNEQKIYCSRDKGCAVAHVGGNLNNGANAGVRNWNLNNSSTNTNWNNAGQTLIRIKMIASLIPYHLVKIKPFRAQFSSAFASKDSEANKK